MDVLVALGTSVAFAYSVYVVLANRHGARVRCVSAAVLVLVAVAAPARGEIRGVRGNRFAAGAGGEVATVVRPGQRVPVDGIVREGHSTMDTSMITGESIRERRPGDIVLGGTVNQNGAVRVEATAVGGDAALQRLARMVEEAQEWRAPKSRSSVDRVAAVFMPS